MELTTKQNEGLAIAINDYKNKKPYTVIAGYAGTGKSTLVKFIISALAQEGVDPNVDVCYCAFTGKACTVLSKKGNKNVSTLHKLLYKSMPKETGGYIRRPVARGEIKYKVLVIDEVSMVPLEMISLLLTHNIYCIFLGDPFQLPPIDKNADNGLLKKPDIFLDEIMRQAAESEIIQLTMKIRNGERIDTFSGNDVMILDKSKLNTGMLQWADQVLVGTNNTRIGLNNQMRALAQKSGNPEEGDKVIALRNYWDEFDNEGNALVNGIIGYVKNGFESFFKLPYWVKPNVPSVDILTFDFVAETGEEFSQLSADLNMFNTGITTLDWKTTYKLGRNEKTQHLIPKEFAYAYAITTHKAQGSEWDKVLVVEESFPFDKKEHAQWLYTAATRAADKLILVR